jgi:hypothetical protein
MVLYIIANIYFIKLATVTKLHAGGAWLSGFLGLFDRHGVRSLGFDDYSQAIVKSY